MKYIFILSIMILSACGNVDTVVKTPGIVNEQPMPSPTPSIPYCTTTQVSNGVYIKCGDDTPIFISNGKDGQNGSPGTPGSTGPQGNGCTVTTLLPSHDNPTGGAQVTCGNTSTIIVNGAAGSNGSAYVVVGSVDPCGNSGSGQDEIFLRMASGALVALFVDNSSALTARLSYIRDGVGYVTTDTQHCTFNLTTDNNGVRTIQYTSPVVGSESWQTY